MEGTYATVTGKQENGDHLPFIPAGKLKFELKFEREELGPLTDAFIKAGTSTAFAQEHPAPEEEPTGAYTLLDAGIGFSIPIGKQHMIIEFSVNNLLDEKYIDHLSTLKEVGYYDPGRNFAIAMKLPFRIL